MLVIILLVSVTVFLSLWLWWQTILKRGSGHIISGCIPIIGHTLKITGNTVKFWKFLEHISMESIRNDGVSRMILAFNTYYVLTDPEDLATVGKYCTDKDFPFTRFAKDWLGNGLITAPTSIWKRHRKLLNPAFTPQILNGFVGVFNAQARELADRLAKEVDKGPLDISLYFRKNAMKNLSQTALGISGENADGIYENYTKAVDQFLELIVLRFQNIWLHSDVIYKLIGLKKKETVFLKALNDMTNAVIQEKRLVNNTERKNLAPSLSGIKSKAFLDLLLELSADDVVTDDEIREELHSIYAAGTDTSSWLVNYTCAALGTYPDVQEKVVEEINQVLGDSDRDLDKDAMQKLVYMEAVIKETLRLYPVGPVSLRITNTYVKLRNITIKPGDHIFISFYGLNRHPVWGPDADQFRPERWLEAEVLPNSFGGFGIGKRSCIGKSFAMMSMKTSLVHLLRRYHVSGDITKMVMKLDFVGKPVTGHAVGLTTRHRFNIKRNLV